MDNEDGEIEVKKIFNKKIAAGAGGGILAFTSIVFAYIDNKTDALDQKINDNIKATREYVDQGNRNIDDKLNRIESVLLRIDDKIYEIIKSRK